MSVLIKGMEIPKTCFDCIACVSGWCEATDKSLKYETITRGKPKWCPLVEVPTTDVLDKIYADIQELRNCSCSCSDGIIDDVEDIINKYRAENEVEE